MREGLSHEEKVRIAPTTPALSDIMPDVRSQVWDDGSFGVVRSAHHMCLHSSSECTQSSDEARADCDRRRRRARPCRKSAPFL